MPGSVRIRIRSVTSHCQPTTCHGALEFDSVCKANDQYGIEPSRHCCVNGRTSAHGRYDRRVNVSELRSQIVDEVSTAFVSGGRGLGHDIEGTTDRIIAIIRDVMLSQEWEGPIHSAMSTWVSRDFTYRLNNEGEPTHEASMATASVAVNAALAAAGLTGGQGDE